MAVYFQKMSGNPKKHNHKRKTPRRSTIRGAFSPFLKEKDLLYMVNIRCCEIKRESQQAPPEGQRTRSFPKGR